MCLAIYLGFTLLSFPPSWFSLSSCSSIKKKSSLLYYDLSSLSSNVANPSWVLRVTTWIRGYCPTTPNTLDFVSRNNLFNSSLLGLTDVSAALLGCTWTITVIRPRRLLLLPLALLVGFAVAIVLQSCWNNCSKMQQHERRAGEV